MSKSWKINLWGVRGSAPTPLMEYMEYGGNTTCISVERENHMVIFDAGTGLTVLGGKLNQQKHMRLDIIISHLHIDHVTGLFLFQPFFSPNMEICLHGGIGLKQHLKQLISSPWWPIGIQDFKAKICFHEIQVGASFNLGNFTVSTMNGNHPGNSILYRLDSDGKSLIYALDCEADEEIVAKIENFSYGSDLIVWDAYFTDEDFVDGWGHSTWKQGIKAGHNAAIKRVLMTHYNHEYTDKFLHSQEEAASKDAICLFAKEGMEIIL